MSAGNLHEDVLAFDRDGIDRVNQSWLRWASAGGQVDLPAMPGASDERSLTFPFRKRSTLVWADAIDGVDHAAAIEERDHTAIAFDLETRAGGQIIECGELHEAGHRRNLLRVSSGHGCTIDFVEARRQSHGDSVQHSRECADRKPVPFAFDDEEPTHGRECVTIIDCCLCTCS